MAIDKDKIVAGITLAARYKGEVVKCEVTTDAEGKLQYTVNGKTFNSPSKAGSEAAGSTSVNGYRFWSLESELGEARAPKAKAEGETAPKVKKGKAAQTKPEDRGKTTPQIKKLRKQDGATEGHTKYFCSACMKGFEVSDAEHPNGPSVCPEGHPKNVSAAEDAGMPTEDAPEAADAAAPAEEPVTLDI